ncbi:hypothetical protein BN946_scf184270.g3 [Trametes cinnabarina]|uniref:Uncharacterized protein n=1 Tax=Pycnoporus cinnabarinus TaxID=5643 RepID=A0A060S4Z2_PYCCI|nr:hypothetical protein BN946_scf184270.g3 [Trametes cinnabarina]
MEGHKRKRDSEGSVVTFYAPDRTFQRVYKDEDFEAFQHLARHVTTLDVSVLVGNAGPPLFSRLSSVQSPTNDVVSKKRKKKHQEKAESRVAIAELTSGRDAPVVATTTPPSTSTIDANGHPKKKRKRGEEPTVDDKVAPAQRAPDAEAIDTTLRSQEKLAETSSKPSKKNSYKDGPAAPSSGQPVTASIAPSSSRERESPLPPVGSKRKRQDSPPAPAVKSKRPSAPIPAVAAVSRLLSPSSPARKKRKKDKLAQSLEGYMPAGEASLKKVTKHDKERKSKADDASAPEARPRAPEHRVSELCESDAADVEDNVVTGQSSREEKKKKKKTLAEAVKEAHEGPQPQEKQSKKKRKHQDAEDTQELIEAKTSSIEPGPISEASTTARKEKRKRQKSQEQVLISEMVLPEPVALAPPAEPSTAHIVAEQIKKREKKKKSAESKETDAAPSGIEHAPSEGPLSAPSDAHVPAEAGATPKEKKKKRRKTLAADTSVDPESSSASIGAFDADVTGIEAPPAPAAQPESALSKKRNKRKSNAPNSPSAPSNIDISAVVQAAVASIMARNQATTGSTNAESPSASQQTSVSVNVSTPEPESVKPGRKRKAGKSKLRQAWGPEDIADSDKSFASISPPTPAPKSAPQQAIESTAPSSVSAKVPKPPVKAIDGKKARPSGALACPICDEASVHPRAECPVIQGGAESIRKCIAQFKKAGRDSELVEELEVHLKEAQRRRKSVPNPAPLELSPSTTRVEPPSSPALPSNIASPGSVPARPALPRVPAGSEISEVAVESKDEGSSNDSASDSDDEDSDAEQQIQPTASISIAPPSSMSAQDLASIDLEALLRGPVKPRGSILNQIPSEDGESSEDDEDEDEDAPPADDIDLSEEEKNDRAYRRMSRRLERDAPSSSDDEREPEAELANSDVDVDADPDPIVPPVNMDPDPNDTIGQQPEGEAGDPAIVEDEADLAGENAEIDGTGANTKSPVRERSDQGYESDAEEVAASATPPNVDEKPEQEAAEDEAQVRELEQDAGPAAPAADRGDDSRVERSADVDGPVASQEPAEDEDKDEDEPQPQRASEEASDVDDASAADASHDREAEECIADKSEGTADKSEESAERHEVANALSEKEEYDVEEVEGAAKDAPSRAVSPELGQTPPEEQSERTTSPPPLRQPDPVVEDVDIAVSTSSAADRSLDLRPDHEHELSDPIESLGSFADIPERRTALDDDPIEDADELPPRPSEPRQQDHNASQLSASQDMQTRAVTPPAAVHRTPGTVSRMKDRHGRLSRQKPIASLSEQLLGSLMSSQSQASTGMREGSEELAEGPEVEVNVQEGEAATQSQPEQDTTSQDTQPEIAEQEEEELRPRRTTRMATRRGSAMPRATSVADADPPAPTPTSAAPAEAPAPRRRGGRLTAEEKAAREADKKAARELKAAEKKAEKEAKEAAKKAEKEAKEAAKQRAENEQEPDQASAQQAVESAGPSESTPGFSKISWTALPATQPRTQSEAAEAESSMVDELQPSSPGATRSPEPISHVTGTTDKDEADVSREVTVTQERPNDQDDVDRDNLPTATPKPLARPKEPLFIPSASQFPDTPFPHSGLPQNTPHINGVSRGDASGDEAGDDARPSEGDDVFKVPAPRPRASWMASAPFRRLSDIASQEIFSNTQIPSPALYSVSQPRTRTSSEVDGQDDDDDEDSEDSDGSSSESDSEAEAKKSHIPKERRAGANMQRKKSSLLGSLR